MNIKLEAVIFDMDGLMLAERLSIPSMRVASKAIGINITDNTLIELIGLNENDSNAFLEKRLGKPIDWGKFSAAFYQDYLRALTNGGIRLKEGLIELINFLKENNLRLAVATSTKTDLALKKLRLAGILNQFEIVIGSDQVAQGKPAPDIYLKAATELGVNINNCLALEDSDNGALSAFRAGIKVIVVPDIKAPSRTTQRIASNICGSLSEAKKLILNELS